MPAVSSGRTLPTGTVTFLFTDIEGSTQLWEQRPEAMSAALAHHDALLNHAIEDHNGSVFKKGGDAFCAVFATASEALAAALAAQIALHHPQAQAASADTGLTLRVRMALHTGTAEQRDEDYFGPALNRVARLLAAGHGGQVLVSEATQGLVQGSLPSGASLKDLGEHRLKDLERAERIFQLLHPDLPADFPPLRSLDAFRHNLPIQLTSFIGRETEILNIKKRLKAKRMLTLTGIGGCGKTRLALQVAAEVVEEYPDGVWLVELAALTDPTLVPQQVATVLGVKEAPGRPLPDTLAEALKPRHMLLLLDNCEHLKEACSLLADTLLRAAPGLQILATSRAVLSVPGETTYRVPCLDIPPDPEQLPSLDTFREYEAVRLFVEHATSVEPTFAITAQNAPALARICQLLDGIPLAIELAASRVRALPVERIAQRLEHHFDLLSHGAFRALPRQKTLRATIDWSYNLLDEPERTLLRGLAVFAGGWSLEAAEAVCAGERIEDWQVLDLLTQLVDESLVIYQEQAGRERYRLLETVRKYALDKLEAAGEADQVRSRHLEYFLGLAEEAESKLRGPEQADWLKRLESEHDNLRAALKWPVHSEMRLRLASALWRFWATHGYFSEGRSWLEGALSRSEGISESVRAKALNGAGVLATRQADHATARSLLEQSLAIRRQLEDIRGVAEALNNLGIVLRDQGDYAAAQACYEESLAKCRTQDDKWMLAAVLNNMGSLALDQHEYTQARSCYEESLAFYKELGDTVNIASTSNNLAVITFGLGDYAQARRFFQQSLASFRELGNRWAEAITLTNLASAVMKLDEPCAAESLLQENKRIRYSGGEKSGMAYPLMGLANVAEIQKDYPRAVQLLAAAETVRDTFGVVLSPSQWAEYIQEWEALRAKLTEEDFKTSWERGKAMTLEEILSLASQNTNKA